MLTLHPHTQIESLDIYLPLLLLNLQGPPSSLAVATSTAQMLASIVRSDGYRRAVTEWLPASERQREIKSRRGWEKTAALSANQAAPWIARQLLTLLGDPRREADAKVRWSRIWDERRLIFSVLASGSVVVCVGGHGEGESRSSDVSDQA